MSGGCLLVFYEVTFAGGAPLVVTRAAEKWDVGFAVVAVVGPGGGYFGLPQRHAGLSP